VLVSLLFVHYLGEHTFDKLRRLTVGDEGVYWKSGAILAVLWIFMNWHHGVYERGLRGISSPIVRVRSVLRSGVYAIAVLIIATSLYRGSLLSPLGWGGVLVLAGAIQLLIRVILRRLDRFLARRGVVCQRIVVVGTDKESRDFAVRLRAQSSTVRVVGFMLHEEIEQGATFLNSPVLGDVRNIEEVCRRFPFDALVLPPTARWEALEPQRNGLMQIVNFCEANRITLYIAPSSYDIAVRRQEVASFSNVPLILLKDASLHPGYALVKRCMDVAVSGLGLLIGLPLWLAIALGIKLTGKGPIFFRQTRIGLYGKPFKMIKFRSMIHNAEDKLDELVDLDELREPVFKIQEDPRVTRFGKFLRQTGLDEVPQLWCVLTGSMSLVGPRPEEERVVSRYDAHQRRRLKAKPGITGLQQVECRGSQSLSRRITYDLIYMKHQGLLMDLYILFKTILVVFRGSGTSH
jgi:exopolysaccharide biosynthesis polyprenyl glycosylphosphotransferase